MPTIIGWFCFEIIKQGVSSTIVNFCDCDIIWKERTVQMVYVPKVSLKNTLSLSTSLERQRVHWNKTVQDSRAFVPWEHRDISEEDAEKANKSFGEFASGYMGEELSIYTQETGELCYPRILSAGWGRGYDHGWLRQAISSGFQTSIVDISDIACSWAEEAVRSEWIMENSQHDYFSKLPPEPEVMQVEISSALANSETFLGFELGDVAIWYMSRVLGCLPSERVAKNVLVNMGESLKKEAGQKKFNRIVLVCALRDDNLDRVGRTSKLYSRRMILRNISQGASRPVTSCREAVYRYFGQVYTAMTIITK